MNKITVKSKKTIPLWMVLVLGLPLPLLSDLLSIGGKSFVEYTYLFLIGYYVLADEKVVDKAEKNSLLLFSVGLIATILNVYLFIWSDVKLAFLNMITKCRERSSFTSIRYADRFASMVHCSHKFQVIQLYPHLKCVTLLKEIKRKRGFSYV